MGIWVGIVALSAALAPGPVPPGTVTVAVVEDGNADEAPDAATFAEVVGHAFNAADFLVLPAAGASRYRARVAIAHEARGLVDAPAQTRGADVGVANWGAGVSIALPTRKQNLQALIVTRMTITLSDWRDGRVLWTGSAVTAQVGGTPGNAPAVVGAKLADALVARIPAVLDGPLSIP